MGMTRLLRHGLLALGLVATATTASAAAYDIAINGGRVVDPASGLDAVRHIGIAGDRIVAVSETPLDAARVIDATGKVVSPGFIDLHAHGQSALAARVQALDGVTTALELEGGELPVAAWYDSAAKQGRPINYGASVAWAHARIATMVGISPGGDPEYFRSAFGDPRWQTQIADPAQLQQILDQVRAGLDEGGLGIGILLGYAPGTSRKEYHALTALAAERAVPTFTHARYLSMLEPRSSFEGMAEIVAAAASTGAHAHIVHFNSISLRDIDSIAPLIAGAQRRGVRITTEAYPYGAGSTGIGAAMFRGPDWRERVGGVTAANFDVNGRRLTEDEFARLQEEAPGTGTVVHILELEDPADRAVLDRAVLFPGGVIASDGGDWLLDGKLVPPQTWPLPEDAWSHPRSAGTFARFLRMYVREARAIPLLEAIDRVSYGPARILEESVPQMRRKGRLQPGADADIVVFDLERVGDRATYETPARTSTGIEYVLVNGAVLVADGVLDPQAMPGRAIRNAPRTATDPGAR
jgi:N-acyl-D-glutamate deacylase